MAAGIVPAMDSVKAKWQSTINTVFKKAILTMPENVYQHTGSEAGMHTEHLGYLLAEMQYLQRAYPGAKW